MYHALVTSYQPNIEILIDVGKRVFLEANAEDTKYMLLSCHQIIGKYHGVKITNRSFENALLFKHLRTATEKNSGENLVDCIWVTLATVQSGTFCHFICCLKT
jgi:hypothetical protein